MIGNRELHKQLRSGRARFYPADFHIHSPASADVRLSPRFGELSAESQTRLASVPEKTAKSPVEYESRVIDAFPPSCFYDSLLDRRGAILIATEAEDGDDWAIVAVTDHNVCKYACQVATHAWAQLGSHRLIVLPGIELTVIYPVPPDSILASAHLLCIFSPSVTDSDIRIAIGAAAGINWTFGEALTLQSLSDFVNKVRHHSEYPAICIAAHVGSSEGVQNETRKAILSQLDAAISRIRGELQVGDDPDAVALRERSKQLEQERAPADQIAIEVLDLIGGCGFDALQVRGRADETHYKRLHRFREQMGRAAPIVCSDAHRQEDVFSSEAGVPHIKLADLSARMDTKELFDSVRKALRLGETRFTYISPEAPQYWISGLEIAPDAPDAVRFWPFATTRYGEPMSFVLPLSRNLNCIIGGRGSGKSAALEALAFVAQQPGFDGFERTREEDLPDHYGRAKANLAGCKLKLCWQFVKYDQAAILPKRAVFASRYFDPGHRHQPVTYSSVDGIELLHDQIPECDIQYYRLGQIEKQAGAAQLRELFDRICGKRIQDHEQQIAQLAGQLQVQRDEMVQVSRNINQLTQESAPLRDFVRRKRLFDEVNTKEIKDAYEEVDRSAAAEVCAQQAVDGWKSIRDEFPLDAFAEQINQYFNDVNEASTEDQNHPKPYQEKLAELSRNLSVESEEPTPPRRRVTDAIDSLDKELTSVAEEVLDVQKDIATSAKGARDALVEKGLPTGSMDREAKKTAFEEAEKALNTYRELLVQWDELNGARKNLVKEIQEECNKRTELRQSTASRITAELKRDLDPSVLVIEADAQAQMDKKDFRNWLDTYFASQDFKHRKVRIETLLQRGLTPDKLRNLLLDEGGVGEGLLQVDAASAELGSISQTVARGLVDRCVGRCRLECEVNEGDLKPELWKNIPEEIRHGLLTFPLNDKKQSAPRIDDILKLDEILFDDVPVIRLNDRPKDEKSKARPVEELSPGQRCSAILPILLLTGTSPLLIDQPEDNMDNRLIRQVIVNILSSIKLRRQVILATHNPNLPVLGDVEQAIILQGVGERECQVRAIGDLDAGNVVHHLTEVMEGGREAFQYRQTIYQVHWPGHVSTSVVEA